MKTMCELRHWPSIAGMSPQSHLPFWGWVGWVHWIVFMTSLYMYYAPSLLDSCFLSTLCHQQISVLVNVYSVYNTLLYFRFFHFSTRINI